MTTNSRLAKLAESNSVIMKDNIRVESGHGPLPSICPNCHAALDFGKMGDDELVCRSQCGWRFINESN